MWVQSEPSMLTAPNLLSSGLVEIVTTSLNGLTYRDGKGSAAGAARQVKQNQEADADQGGYADIERMVKQAMAGSTLVGSYARPVRWSRLIFSRYAVGDAYGEHVDAPFMRADDGSEMRADLSFTAFLTGPEAYDGGELVLDTPWGRHAVKLEAGSVVVYPTSVLHFVAPVRSGVRQVCVGWMQSRIRDHEQRTMMFDLERSISGLAQDENRRRLTRVFAGLLKMWSS